ncbi:zinc knuckle CX2CX4HX4C [Artemisia annua]|uniref:Zinc knuckle CX2CX4HX4C n=1 Tax=Artemisia annua TaxID=35608 RepID=A0A2U1NMY9_ARTAN|nr:zinc knuckle CX2CX4HX4C [Artemisia annua]
MSRNSSKRQLKVPAKFDDSVHDLDSRMKNQNMNKKKNKECLAKDTSVGNKKDTDGNSNNQTGDGIKMVNEELVKDGDKISKTVDVNGDKVEKEIEDTAGKEESSNGNEQTECTAGKEESRNANTPVAATNVSTSSKDSVKNSYAEVVNKNVPLFDGKLKLIPTEVDDSGNEFVIFDDEMVKTGSSRCMCKIGVGRVGYARVLIEVSAKKGLPDKIDVKYKNNVNEITGNKTIQVKYDWIPPLCTECCVFGHCKVSCPTCVNTKVNVEVEVSVNKKDNSEVMEGFNEVVNKRKERQVNKNKNNMNKPPNQPKRNVTYAGVVNKQVYKPKEMQSVNPTVEGGKSGGCNKTKEFSQEKVDKVKIDKGKKHHNDIGGVKTANKFDTLSQL